MIDVKPLRYFVALAEALHFGRAAAQLHISQPPLSRQLAALEESIGVMLIERSPQKVTLTAAGHQFYADAKSILALLAQAEKNAQAAEKGSTGTLTIGFTMCAAYSVVPRYTRTYSATYPEVQLNLREVVSHDLAAEILNGCIDAAIMFPISPTRDLLTRTIVSEPLCVALPLSHPMASATKIHISELAGEAFVMSITEVAPTLRNTIVKHCQDGGFEPDVRIEVQLQQTILNLVNEEVGIALVPDSMRKAQLSNLTFIPLEDSPTIEQVIAWSPTNRNPCLNRFLELI